MRARLEVFGAQKAKRAHVLNKSLRWARGTCPSNITTDIFVVFATPRSPNKISLFWPNHSRARWVFEAKLQKKNHKRTTMNNEIRAWLALRVEHTMSWCVALQRWRTPARDRVMRLVSALGDEAAYVVLFAVLFGGGARASAALLGVHWALLFALNNVLKALACLPRPAPPAVTPLEHAYAAEWGFPVSYVLCLCFTLMKATIATNN